MLELLLRLDPLLLEDERRLALKLLLRVLGPLANLGSVLVEIEGEGNGEAGEEREEETGVLVAC